MPGVSCRALDTLTYALSGALIARATSPREADDKTLPLARRVFVGFLAAAASDLDFVIGYLGPIEYLYHHRGVTHSLVLLPLWSYLLARLCAVIWRRDRPWRAAAIPCHPPLSAKSCPRPHRLRGARHAALRSRAPALMTLAA